jgi:hypothetical protein
MELPDPPRSHLAVAPLSRFLLGLLLLAAGGGCKKVPAPAPAPAPAAPRAPVGALPIPEIDVASLVARVGVKPGPLTHADVGPAASVLKALGPVWLRRVGEERFVDAPAKTALFAGDQVWTPPHVQATVALADDTLVQMADETIIVIGNRGITSDPASSVAVLYGVARMSISPRARGEGAFVTGAGPVLVGAKGTVFGVAVVAGGIVRVGLEHGEAEVAGAAALDKPVSLETAQAVLVDPKGVVGKPEPFKTDDWGTWRFEIETNKMSPAAAARLHADRLLGAESRLDAVYQALQTLGTQASTLTWQAEANTKPKGLAEYKSSAVERAAAIEGMYRLATEIARLTNAALSDATILSELYRRHPKEIESDFMEFGREVAATVLYNKKLQVVSDVFLEPLRPAYYAHTARGRARAATIGVPSPGIFAQVKLTELTPAEVAKRVPQGLYVPPRLESATRLHPVWQRAPATGWDERLTLQPVPPRQGSWYLPPTQVEGHLVAGVPLQGTPVLAFTADAPTSADKAELSFLIPPLPRVGPDAGQ